MWRAKDGFIVRSCGVLGNRVGMYVEGCLDGVDGLGDDGICERGGGLMGCFWWECEEYIGYWVRSCVSLLFLE